MIQVIFEDADLIVVNKPHGVLTVPPRLREKDSRPILGIELERHVGGQIFPVHRLDFEVSGLVLFAKNAKVHSLANSWFESKKIKKTYAALCSGPSLEHLPEKYREFSQVIAPILNQENIWASKILKGKKRSYYHQAGKPSETRATYLGLQGSDLSLWHLQPVTGRSHQLRLELSQRGFPIIGDKLYGSSILYKENAIALQAFKLEFPQESKYQTLEIPVSFDLS